MSYQLSILIYAILNANVVFRNNAAAGNNNKNEISLFRVLNGMLRNNGTFSHFVKEDCFFFFLFGALIYSMSSFPSLSVSGFGALRAMAW